MAASPVPDLIVQSHQGPYVVHFGPRFAGLESPLPTDRHLLIDAKVAQLYGRELEACLSSASVHLIEAREENKALEALPRVVSALLDRGIKRSHAIVAVGGGIVQDIAAFIASTLMRGLPWSFHPTTLLAQADSCIGSKSSINVNRYKNVLGTYRPPTQIHVAVDVLDTLTLQDLRSGTGEIIKVHVIDGWDSTRELAADYSSLLEDRRLLERYVRRSLEIKRRIIEVDEFDTDIRLTMNYGHTFGHAIESATGYEVPHGIAVTLGMSIANYFSWQLELIGAQVFAELQHLLARNYAGFDHLFHAGDAFLAAMARDKKNTGERQALVLLRGPGAVFRTELPRTDVTRLSAEFERWLSGKPVAQ